jgi:hypothetical protein
MTTRNARYEQANRQQGLEKVTIWLPSPVMADFKLAAKLCVENRDLTVSLLRNVTNGRVVSIQRHVTGDAS